jgi:hypothetical protein
MFSSFLWFLSYLKGSMGLLPEKYYYPMLVAVLQPPHQPAPSLGFPLLHLLVLLRFPLEQSHLCLLERQVALRQVALRPQHWPLKVYPETPG